MRAKGNGNVTECMQNLLSTAKGEIPFLRECGVPLESIDKPFLEGKSQMDSDVQDLITKYEPRAVTTIGNG